MAMAMRSRIAIIKKILDPKSTHEKKKNPDPNLTKNINMDSDPQLWFLLHIFFLYVGSVSWRSITLISGFWPMKITLAEKNMTFTTINVHEMKRGLFPLF